MTFLANVLVSSILVHLVAAAPNYLADYDRLRLQQVVESSLPPKDLAGAFHAISASKLLGIAVPKPEEVCQYLVKQSKDLGTNLEANYYLSAGGSGLPNCAAKLPTSGLIKLFKDTIQKESPKMPELYYSTLGLKSLNQPLTKEINAKITKTVQTLLKEDDSIANIAYALHIASQMGSDGSFAFDRIEDALVQADEIDGKLLQFEGGLSITALLVSGTYNLAESLKKPPPITPQQTVKFANYFISRRTVQTIKGVQNLLNVITILSQNSFQAQVCVGIVGSRSVAIDQPSVSVRVCDLLGKPLKSQVTVTLENALRIEDNKSILTNTPFKPTNDKMIYSARLVSPKGEQPGVYRLSIKVSGADAAATAKLIGNIEQPLEVKVLAEAEIPEPLLIGSVDYDQMTEPKFHKVSFPNKLAKVLEVDSLQKLAIRFAIKEKTTKKPLLVHQAFIRLFHKTTGREVIFVSERDTNNGYKLDLDVGAKAADLGHLSGAYGVELIVGDTVLSNSFMWPLAEVKLNFGGSHSASAAEQKSSTVSFYKPRPEIKHLFREPERRPPVFVSNLFTGLVLVPLIILFGLWIKIGVNLSNFSFSLSTLCFHLSLGAIFSLFGLFWLQLNMFETLKYLICLGIVAFLSGNKLLSNLAALHKR